MDRTVPLPQNLNRALPRHSTDERQHSVCTYVFTKNGSQWKIKQEHCSSLPDYSIVPGDDALYYFHNPVY